MKALQPLLRGRAPGQIVIQVTDHCNAACPQCGMNRNAGGKRRHMSVACLRRILYAAARNGVQAVSFTGGEPLLRRKFLIEALKHASTLGFPLIRTGTNGFVFQKPEAADFRDRVSRLADALAETQLRNFWISIDSVLPEVHEAMRGLPGVIRGIEKAMPIFNDRGIYPSANLGINRNIAGGFTAGLFPEAYSSAQAYLESFYRRYVEAFHRFYRFAADLGFTIANTCYPMSADTTGADGLSPVYAASSSRRLISFSKPEKVALFQALKAVVPEHRWRLRIFSPLSGLHHLAAAHGHGRSSPYPCRGGVDFFFVSADGAGTFPCGYRGRENFGPYWRMAPNSGARKASCDRCDWECFRDPSEMLGPLLCDFRWPPAAITGLIRGRDFYRLWISDLAYYADADFFNGRKPPRWSRLTRWRTGHNAGAAAQRHF
ncbi:MAG: radical SAM protein [Pseudomonadota bacterium]